MLFALLILLFPAALYLWLLRPRRPARSLQAFAAYDYAHRGLWDDTRPENTLPAFAAAAEHGFGVELDVHLTRDDRLAVLHDDTPERLSPLAQPGRPVSDYTLAELQALPLPCGCHIPSLEEALQVMQGRVPLIIELKTGPRNDVLCAKVLEALRQHDHGGLWCLESFDPRILLWLRRHAPQVLRGQLAYGRKGLPQDAPHPPLLPVMQSLICNALSRPDFIAWDERTTSFGWRMIRRVWRPQTFAWVARSQARMDTLRHDYTLQIFEGFVPKR